MQDNLISLFEKFPTKDKNKFRKIKKITLVDSKERNASPLIIVEKVSFSEIYVFSLKI